MTTYTPATATAAPAPDIALKVAARRRDPVTFTLEGDDHVYSFVAPKNARITLALALGEVEDEAAGLKLMFDWLGEGMHPADNQRLIDRLRDDNDDLDIPTVHTLIEKLMERAAGGRPTG